jgi:hypothetical protein
LGGSTASFNADGSYSGKAGITSLSFMRTTTPLPTGGSINVYSLFISFSDESTKWITQKIDGTLDVYIHGDTGKTLRLTGIPVNGATEVGDVYRMDDGTLKVVI